MNILCIETSTQTGSVAVQRDASVFEQAIQTPRTHTERLIPLIDDTLAEAGIRIEQLDAIAFGRGPGSFIGVRLATAASQGLAAGAGIGLAPVSSMAALAQHALQTHARDHDRELRICVCLDARMNEVYVAEFVAVDGRIRTAAAEQLLRAADVVLPPGGRWLAVGSGFAAWPELSERALARGAALVADLQPRARDLLPFAREAARARALIAPESWRSEYLRDASAWERQ